MEFRLAVFFLFLYYIRPQDWVPGMAGFNIVRPMIVLWLWALSARRERPPVKGLLRTPQDWAMLAYWLWVGWMGPDLKDALMGFLPLVVFYGLTLQSLVTWEKMLSYLRAWNYMLIGVSLLALGSLIKIDFTGAEYITAVNEGRLCIGTWMHNNPNALGHSLAVVTPLTYMLYFWRGDAIGKFVIFPVLSTLALLCIYETQSKGAFLVTALLMVMLFIIGRPLIVKGFATAMALTLGVSALSFLPRMSDMGNLRADEGVQGRLMAWELAKTAMEQQPAGWKQFVAYINWLGVAEKKATHASYVQIGADLGYVGMFLFLLALWTAYRAALQAHKLTMHDDDRERVRRACMLLIVAYAVSGWMINREYHTEYFLLIALGAAIHRLLMAEQEELEAEGGTSRVATDLAEARSSVIVTENPIPLPGLVAALPSLVRTQAFALPALAPIDRPATGLAGISEDGLGKGHKNRRPVAVALPEEEDAARPLWGKIGVLDAAVAAALAWGVVSIWDYILKNL